MAYRLIVLVDPLTRQHHHLAAAVVVGKPATVDSHPEANKLKLRNPNNEGKMGKAPPVIFYMCRAL